eukprot:GDKI01011260.1.p1 GENE.GDKI01011260.1~~GDKI01011260.1.p1  ORF type:complete len:152 (-),score=43.99 GDKI01011260.1:18-473(-)
MSVFACVGGLVEKGQKFVWKMRVLFPPTRTDGTGFRFAVVNGQQSEKLCNIPCHSDFFDKHGICFSNASLIGKGEYPKGSHVRGTGSLKKNEILTFIVDTRDESAPFFRIPELCKENIPLCAEWETLRVCVGAWDAGQGVEIVSFDLGDEE